VDDEELGSFTQYPVRLAWAITIHKSQGLTFERAIIDAGASFAPGQVYVALSRLTGMEGLVLHTRINASQVMTDERVVQYAARVGIHAPDRILQQEQRQYAANKLRESFDMAQLPEDFSEQGVALQAMQIPEKETAAALLRDLLQGSRALLEVSGKFSRQLQALLPEQGQPDYNALQERTTAATHYFHKELDHMLQALDQHIAAWRLKPRTKKYIKAMELLRISCARKKEEIAQAATLASGLQQGTDIGQLLAQVNASKQKEPVTVAKEPAAKKEKGNSNRISLDLYLQGKGIEEIAELRSMAMSTIEGHLITFISTGEITINAFLSGEQLSLMLRHIRQHGTHAGTLKEQLGAAYTYTQIRAALAYQLRLEQEG
jgi:hypothetical protein